MTQMEKTVKILTDKELKDLAYYEWKKLQDFATPVEMRRLSGGIIDGNNSHFCIYGTMTGNCESDRALFLMNICSPCILDEVQDAGSDTIGFTVRKKPRAYFDGRTPLEDMIMGNTTRGFQSLADFADEPIKGMVETYNPYNDERFEVQTFYPRKEVTNG